MVTTKEPHDIDALIAEHAKWLYNLAVEQVGELPDDANAATAAVWEDKMMRVMVTATAMEIAVLSI